MERITGKYYAAQRNAEIEKLRQAFSDKDLQKLKEFYEMLPLQDFDSGGVAV